MAVRRVGLVATRKPRILVLRCFQWNEEVVSLRVCSGGAREISSRGEMSAPPPEKGGKYFRGPAGRWKALLSLGSGAPPGRGLLLGVFSGGKTAAVLPPANLHSPSGGCYEKKKAHP